MALAAGRSRWRNRPVAGHGQAILAQLKPHLTCKVILCLLRFHLGLLTLTVLVTTIDAQWEGMGDVGSARYEPALLPPCPTIRVLSYSN